MPDFENMSPEQLKKMQEQMEQKEYEGLTPEEALKKKREKEEKKQENIALLNETLDFCQKGAYKKEGQEISLGLSQAEMKEIHVFLPEEIGKLTAGKPDAAPCVFSCENKGALTLAKEKIQDPSYEGGVLVLNLASATRPGGAVRDGANGQEEALCRQSSLLLSLESEEAKRYYDYNHALHTHLGSDGVMISPHVAVLRDESGAVLDSPFEVSVLSCSAPMVRMGLEGKSQEEYEEMLQGRISGILTCAGSMGYRNLILGAFGCGVFGNDAAVVSDAFASAFEGPAGQGFAHADFAVLCKDGKDYNYNEFCRNFGRADA